MGDDRCYVIDGDVGNLCFWYQRHFFQHHCCVAFRSSFSSLSNRFRSSWCLLRKRRVLVRRCPQQVVPRLIATANSTVNCIYHPSTVFPSLFKVIFLLSIEQLYLRHEFKPAQISSSYLALR